MDVVSGKDMKILRDIEQEQGRTTTKSIRLLHFLILITFLLPTEHWHI